jgi:hypothetical protein
LVAKTERASRLVVTASRPETARQGLVQEPAIGQDIKSRVGGFDMDRAEGVLPVGDGFCMIDGNSPSIPKIPPFPSQRLSQNAITCRGRRI